MFEKRNSHGAENSLTPQMQAFGLFNKKIGHSKSQAMKVLMGPGVLFNSIKSGLAVDYPIFEPHEDRIYNQYGIIFQSASLAVDYGGGNAVSADTGRPWIAGKVSIVSLQLKNGSAPPISFIYRFICSLILNSGTTEKSFANNFD